LAVPVPVPVLLVVLRLDIIYDMTAIKIAHLCIGFILILFI
jgi:hypothetical protein